MRSHICGRCCYCCRTEVVAIVKLFRLHSFSRCRRNCTSNSPLQRSRTFTLRRSKLNALASMIWSLFSHNLWWRPSFFQLSPPTIDLLSKPDVPNRRQDSSRDDEDGKVPESGVTEAGASAKNDKDSRQLVLDGLFAKLVPYQCPLGNIA